MPKKPTYEELQQRVKELEKEGAEHKRAQKELRDSEEKYRDLFESNKDGIVLTDLEGKIIDCNHSYLDMIGYTKEEARELSYQQITPEKWHEMEAEIVKNQFIKRGYSDEFEKEYIKKDGTVFPVSLKGWLVKDEQGQPIGMWGFVRDVSERKLAEQALRQSEEKYRTLFENAPVGIGLSDYEGGVIDGNPSIINLTGYSLEELKAINISERVQLKVLVFSWTGRDGE